MMPIQTKSKPFIDGNIKPLVSINVRQFLRQIAPLFGNQIFCLKYFENPNDPIIQIRIFYNKMMIPIPLLVFSPSLPNPKHILMFIAHVCDSYHIIVQKDQLMNP